MGLNGVSLLAAVSGLGYYIFRSSNNQKDRFMKDPNDPRVKHLKYITTTATDSKLITSAWWGMARHINYLSDWSMSCGYCLPTGIAGYIIQETINPFTRQLERLAVQTPKVKA